VDADKVNNPGSTPIYSAGVWSFKNSTAVASVTITDAGNVGVGVTPSTWDATFKNIQIGGNGYSGSLYSQANGDISTGIALNGYFNSGWKYTASGKAVTQYEQNNGVHTWSSAASGTAGNAITFAERMRIDASGKVGIGVAGTIPQQLSITGGIGFANMNATDKKLYSPADGCLEWLSHSASGAPFFAVSNSGTQNIRLYSTGTIYAQNTSIQPISSDVNLKQNITNYDKGLTEVLALQPRYFAYKTEPEKILAGFIAQEVDAALPGALIETVDGNKSYQVDWNPLLVKAIQEQQAQIEEMKTKLAALEAKP
jgi:hypothetical protein